MPSCYTSSRVNVRSMSIYLICEKKQKKEKLESREWDKRSEQRKGELSDS
jgi:hypothetical protein